MTNKCWFEEIGEEYLRGNMNSYFIRIKKYAMMHLIECAVWLVTPFSLQYYAGIIRNRLKAKKYNYLSNPVYVRTK